MNPAKPHDPTKYVQEDLVTGTTLTPEQAHGAQLTVIEYAGREGLPKDQTLEILTMLGIGQ